MPANLFLDYLRSQEIYKELCSLHPSPEGNLLECTDAQTASAQIEFFRYFIGEIQPTRILETGTNKGLFAFLLSNILTRPATLFTFGIEELSQKSIDFLNSAQNKIKINFFQGDSKSLLPSFNEPGIEFAWVDGGHDATTAYSDIMNCIRLGIPYIAIDDLKLLPHLQDVLKQIMTEQPNYKKVNNPFYNMDPRGATLIKRD